MINKQLMRIGILLVASSFLIDVSALAQADGDLISGRPFEFEIKPTEPVLEDRGPFRSLSYTTHSAGTLFVHAASEGANLYLCLRDAEGEFLGENDGEDGVRTPCLLLEVKAGQTIEIVLAIAAIEEDPVAVSVNLFEAPETAVTLAAAEALDGAIEEARVLAAQGDRDAARQRLIEAMESALKTTGASESLDMQERLWLLGGKTYELGDLPATRMAWSAVHAFRKKAFPDDDPDLLRARSKLAVTIAQMGDLHVARPFFEKNLEILSRTLSDDHSDLQGARWNLASMMCELGDFSAARTHFEKIVEVLSRTLPHDHTDLQTVRLNLAKTMYMLGDLHEACVLQKNVLEVFIRTLPDDHPRLQAIRENLAATIFDLGDIHAARTLFEKVLEVNSRTLPDDNPDLQRARGNLAGILHELGDLHGARVLDEKVLEVRSRTLHDDHTELQLARMNLAVIFKDLGDYRAAHALEEKVLEVFSRTLPDDHPNLQTARLNMATTTAVLDDLDAARALAEKALEVRSRTLPDDHPDLQVARMNLAMIFNDLGDYHAAHALEEKVLEVFSRTLPDDHPDLLAALANLATTSVRMGALGRAAELAQELGRGARRSFEKFGEVLAPRELETLAIEAAHITSQALSWIPLVASGSELPETFALIETMRAAAAMGSRVRRVCAVVEEDERAFELREEIRKASVDVANLSRGEADPGDLFDAVRRKDAAQRTLWTHLAPLLEQVGALPIAETNAIAATLRDNEAAVGYWRYRRFERDRESGKISGTPSYLAFVVRPGEEPQRIELGEAKPIEDAVRTWRQAIGSGTAEGRGTGVERGTPRGRTLSEEEVSRTRGESLRRLIFDPLLPAIGNAKRIIVALDEVLYLVPLDALPGVEIEGAVSGDAVLGDRFEINVRVTLKELTLRLPELSGLPLLLALGGIDYDGVPLALGEGESHGESKVLETDSAAPLAHAFRGAAGDLVQGDEWESTFPNLPATGPEADSISGLFVRAFPEVGNSRLFKGRDASREAFELLAPKARFLHIATHGYFAPESVPSMRDERPVDEKLDLGAFGDLREQVRGFAPMALCGLALAGANNGANDFGRVSGLMTAEEIAGLDLSSCELAVLSACETNVGIRRAGQGIASMQQALWAAGVRSAITSLWKVRDEATKELMTDFYRRLWIEKKPKAQALWEAKCELRRATDKFGDPKYAIRDWAGWVLTGEPE